MIAPRVHWSSPEGRRRTRELPPAFTAALDRPGRIEDFWLNVRPDPIDFRDKPYAPGLIEIKPYLDPPSVPFTFIRDQGPEGSCTGQALAAAIDIQNIRRRQLLAHRLDAAAIDKLVPERVSARMLYEMARTYDEYPEDGLPGSSARGAIKGFFHNGVCGEQAAPYFASEPGWRLEVGMAKEARCTALGAYFRLSHMLYDYHAALNEAGSIVVSAMVHEGWDRPVAGRIALADEPKLRGAHAFALVGYDSEGFYVLNSWGPNWADGGRGGPGIAHWLYEDWKRHILDAWVLRLAVPSENTFHLVGGYQRNPGAAAAERPPIARIQVNGHYVHVRNGRFVRSGNFWNDLQSFGETSALLKSVGPQQKDFYRHLLFYAHGGLNDLDAAIARTAVMTPVLKALKIYPVFFIWRTGLWEELRDVLRGPGERAAARVQELSDLGDVLLEGFSRSFVKPVWREMKDDARRAMFPADMAGVPTGDGWAAARQLIVAAAEAGMRVHFVGHSAGAMLLGELLRRASGLGETLGPQLGTISLFAPACTEAYFTTLRSDLETVLGKAAPEIAIYNLTDRMEREDSVGGVYRKSLLYLISNALEEKPETPILGFEAVAARVALRFANVKLHLSDGSANGVTEARAHGGFDEDPATLNHLLNRICGTEPMEDGTLRRPIGPTDKGFAAWMFQS